jgi:hypothetical protein
MDGGTDGYNDSRDVRTYDGRVGCDAEARVALITINWVERHRFHFNEDFVGTWFRSRAVGEFETGTL